MALDILGLVLLAAFLHAGWNALVKASTDRLLVISAVALGQCTAGILAIPFVPVPAPESWPSIGVSTLCHFLYYTFLYQAYRFGDLSQVYPVARGMAPVLVTIGAAIFGNELLPLHSMIGVLIASAGIASITFFQQKSLKGNPAALLFAGATGAVIAGYSVADGVGVRLSGSPFGYIAWLFAFELPVVVFVALRRQGLLLSHLKHEWKSFSGTAISSLSAYAIVIYAFNFTPMGAVSALRESSVIMAALIGAFILGERPWLQRVFAALAVAAGVMLIVVPR